MVNERYKTMSDKNIPLIEKIMTWQGEGCNAGKRMLLVRFKYCSCHCPFCDTWTKMGELKEDLYSINDIIKQMKDESIENLMITGGEPTLGTKRPEGIKNNIDSTLDLLTYVPFEYADVETNGYNIEDLLHRSIKIMNHQINKHINISYSPKFFKPSDVEESLIKCQYISLYAPYYPILKVVVADELSKSFVYRLINEKIYNPNYLYLMPLGTTDTEIKKSFPDVVKMATELKCNISGRMHLTHDFV